MIGECLLRRTCAPNQPNYPPQLLQQAAAFDPRTLDRLRAMQAYAGENPEHQAVAPMFRQLLGEAGGGPQARPPEAIVFQAQQGELSARQQMAGFEAARAKTIDVLTRDLDPAEFERFKQQQRMNANMLQPQGGVINGALQARQNLLDVLSNKR